MRRFVALVMVMVLALSLVACGSSEPKTLAEEVKAKLDVKAGDSVNGEDLGSTTVTVEDKFNELYSAEPKYTPTGSTPGFDGENMSIAYSFDDGSVLKIVIESTSNSSGEWKLVELRTE